MKLSLISRDQVILYCLPKSHRQTKFGPVCSMPNQMCDSHVMLHSLQTDVSFLRSLGWRLREKRPLPWVETVLSMRGDYLATEFSRDTLHVVRAHSTTAELL